jgi:hypothetical protein
MNARMSQLGKLAQAKRTPAERARFARLGGLTAQRNGTAHLWTPESAKRAGRLGGLASGAARRKRKAAAPSTEEQ